MGRVVRRAQCCEMMLRLRRQLGIVFGEADPPKYEHVIFNVRLRMTTLLSLGNFRLTRH